MSRLGRGCSSRLFVVGLGVLLGAMSFTFIVALAPASNRSADKGHWSDGSGTRAWVTLVDKTGPNWPVFAAAIEWDNAGRIDVTYRSGDCGGNGHCVSVDTWDPGVGCRTANSSFAYTPAYGGNHLQGDTFIALNKACATNDNFTNGDRRVITCQEEGHVLGLAHALNASHHDTCMAATGDDFDHADNTPQQHDFVMLDDVIYDHND